MDDNHILQMRDLIMVADEYARSLDGAPEAALIEEAVQPAALSRHVALLEDLQDVAFKLRAFMENAGGEYALGVETGMQRAADMIDNLIRRHDGEA